ncbi:MAG: tRNA (adenosine(37)-N6)-threonylcarbamoyltransferase complex dimerization subunit type 1 TsaB [Chloroflexi bacterium]|nr:tRNA (adenosine(37)-N6)-threonylcarbamoyltransferase complex dimerization subunit type 1 TsaB [Chloroflexota bacterium]
MILSIDTSTKNCSLALYEPKPGVLAREFWTADQDHTVALAPRLDKLLGPEGLTKVDGVVVALGPGSFTGTRAGLSLAKGLALANSLPLVGITTPDALAHSQRVAPFPLYALLEAGRGRVSVTPYSSVGGKWERSGEYRLTTLPTLAHEVEGTAIFCGEINDPTLFLDQRHAGTVVFPEVFRWPTLSRLGWERIERGEVDNLHELEPIYLSSD